MTLLCPACKRPLVPIHVGKIEIDFCRLGCKGLWFDPHELQQVDEQNKGFGDVLAEALDAPPRMRSPGPIKCPRCARLIHAVSYRQSGVFIDTCYVCGGYFVDSGKLKQIHEFMGSPKAGDIYRMRRELMTYKSPPEIRFMPKHYSDAGVGTAFF